MTKKDYLIIAKAIKETKKAVDDYTGMATLEVANEIKTEVFGHLQAQLEYILIQDNPRFNSQKFLKACEIEE